MSCIRMYMHVSSQKEGAMPDESTADLNGRLMSSQAQLSFDHGMPPIQATKPLVCSLDPLYD